MEVCLGPIACAGGMLLMAQVANLFTARMAAWDRNLALVPGFDAFPSWIEFGGSSSSMLPCGSGAAFCAGGFHLEIVHNLLISWS